MKVGQLVFRKEYAEIDRWNAAGDDKELVENIANRATTRAILWGGGMAVSGVGAIAAISAEGSLSPVQRGALAAVGIGGVLFSFIKAQMNLGIGYEALIEQQISQGHK